VHIPKTENLLPTLYRHGSQRHASS
jgi:hypothetical protein